jgi:hypothetical protein
MRIVISILSATTFLLFGCRDNGSIATDAPLSFYIVSAEKIEGGRFIDTPDFPKLGYIPTVPALMLTKLEAVIADVSREQVVMVNKDGKETVEPMKKRAALYIRMRTDDAKKFTALTEQAVGKHVLLMLGDTPLIAARVMTPIATQDLQLTFGEQSDAKKIEDALRRLTK